MNDLVYIPPQRPPQELIAAATDEAGVSVLADWMEEQGDHRSTAVRAIATARGYGTLQERVIYLLDQPLKPPQLEWSQLTVIRQAESLTARQRIDAFLRVNVHGDEAKGKRGRPHIESLQHEVTQRLIYGAKGLRRITFPPRAVTQSELSCADRGSPDWWEQRCWRMFTTAERDNRRARKTGDDAIAIAVGKAYHRNVKSLFTSQRASVVYGVGGQEGHDDDAYSKAYRSKFGGARWSNAGARMEYTERGQLVVIETSRGTQVARIPLPRDKRSLSFKGLLDGDVYGTERTISGVKIITRWGLKRTQLVETGLAVWCEPRPDVGLNDGWYEHGKTIEDIRAAIKEKIEAARVRAAQERVTKKQQRKVKLVARLCKKLQVTHEDRKSVGFCEAGTRAFMERFGLTGDVIEAGVLRDTGDTRVFPVIEAAARRLVLSK